VAITTPSILGLLKGPGEYWTRANIGVSDGTIQEIFSYTVPAGKTLYITQKIVTCIAGAKFFIEVDGNSSTETKTSPGAPTLPINFFPSEPIASSSVVKLKFCAKSGYNYYGALIGSLV